MGQFERTELLIGAESIEKLKKSRVAVFGIGGVGGYVVEALARSGVGTLDLIDSDTVCESNLNRQIIALHSTLGMLVGWLALRFGLAKFQMVVCLRSEYQGCFPFWRKPYSTGSCCH